MMMHDLEPRLREAVRHFWITRQSQSSRHENESNRERGGRSAVTGGKQMDGFVQLVHELLIAAGVPETCIASNSRIELPGWFRAEKKWDVLVVHNGELLIAIEFKSHVGPSFGNNFNNRTEEALGSATDIWAAFREGAFKPSSRPVLGYLMLLEDCPGSRKPVRVAAPHFPVFAEFKSASYCDRYMILIEKLLRERLYDTTCFLISKSDAAVTGNYEEPHLELTFERFVAPLLARVVRYNFR